MRRENHGRLQLAHVTLSIKSLTKRAPCFLLWLLMVLRANVSDSGCYADNRRAVPRSFGHYVSPKGGNASLTSVKMHTLATMLASQLESHGVFVVVTVFGNYEEKSPWRSDLPTPTALMCRKHGNVLSATPGGSGSQSQHFATASVWLWTVGGYIFRFTGGKSQIAAVISHVKRCVIYLS